MYVFVCGCVCVIVLGNARAGDYVFRHMHASIICIACMYACLQACTHLCNKNTHEREIDRQTDRDRERDADIHTI